MFSWAQIIALTRLVVILIILGLVYSWSASNLKCNTCRDRGVLNVAAQRLTLTGARREKLLAPVRIEEWQRFIGAA